MREKPLAVDVPPTVRDEVEAVARRTRRSVAFVVRRALAAQGALEGALAPLPPGGGRASLLLTTDEDDRPGVVARIRSGAGGRPLGEALTAAWAQARERFFAWAEREEAAGQAERADSLDEGLRDASSPETPAARLAELAGSEYPRVRILVARHPSTPDDARARLAADPDRVVRQAASGCP